MASYYVTGDKVCCVYIASNEELMREHAKQGTQNKADSPRTDISEVRSIIDLTTAEG